MVITSTSKKEIFECLMEFDELTGSEGETTDDEGSSSEDEGAIDNVYLREVVAEAELDERVVFAEPEYDSDDEAPVVDPAEPSASQLSSTQEERDVMDPVRRLMNSIKKTRCEQGKRARKETPGASRRWVRRNYRRGYSSDSTTWKLCDGFPKHRLGSPCSTTSRSYKASFLRITQSSCDLAGSCKIGVSRVQLFL